MGVPVNDYTRARAFPQHRLATVAEVAQARRELQAWARQDPAHRSVSDSVLEDRTHVVVMRQGDWRCSLLLVFMTPEQVRWQIRWSAPQ